MSEALTFFAKNYLIIEFDGIVMNFTNVSCVISVGKLQFILVHTF